MTFNTPNQEQARQTGGRTQTADHGVPGPFGHARSGERGFTIIEVLAAICILTIAVLGVVGAIIVQRGISSSYDVGQSAVNRGQFVSTATFLAQDRVEEIKRMSYVLGPPAVDQIGTGTPPAALPDEDYGTIAGYPDYRREVSVQNAVPGADMKAVTVTVRFRRRNDQALASETIQLRTIVAARP